MGEGADSRAINDRLNDDYEDVDNASVPLVLVSFDWDLVVLAISRQPKRSADDFKELECECVCVCACEEEETSEGDSLLVAEPVVAVTQRLCRRVSSPGGA